MHTKSELFQDKLQQLTEFNQALVYGFDPETSPQEILGSNTYQDTFFPALGQFADVLEGYLFAQNELLPAFRKIEEGSLDEIYFLNYIKQLHGYIGNILLALVEEKSGEYAQQQLFRWNPNADTYYLIYYMLTGTSHPFEGEPTALLIKLLTTQLSLSEAQTQQFIALLHRLKNDITITLRASQEKYIKHIVGITAEKLAVAYLSNKLSAEENGLVRKIVTICRDPEETPKLMDEFAKATLANWRKCDKKDTKAVARFLADMFYQFTDIHPFANANGRTATCLVNVFLRSIGLPSILMRNPGERDVSASSYSKAIDSINQTREPLANHIYQRILEAQKHAFADEKLAEATRLRFKLARQLYVLQSKHPQIDINDYQVTMRRYGEAAISEYSTSKYSTDEDIAICALKKFLRFLAEEENHLEQSSNKGMTKVTSSTSNTTSTSTQPGQLKQGFFTSVKTEGNKALDAANAEKCSDQSSSKGQTTATGFIGTTILSDREREQLKQDLSTLTNNTGWKINPKNHLDSWMETPDQSEAERVSKLLHAAGVGKVSKGMRSDNNQIHVVKCLNINLSELKNKIKSNNAAEAAAPDSEKVNAEINNPTAHQ